MTLEPGDPVGDRFVVEALLGEGGSARVYRVRHTSLGSIHALKMLAPGSGSSQARLLQEGRIQATLRHPCVVPVTDVVDQNGRLGLVMEYVPGPSLADLLSRRALSQEEALALFARILAGVGAAHTSGVLHRDLKPHNVLLAPLTGGWLPKVADFGIARAVNNAARRTRVGFGIGTPGYMAPEQAVGRADVDQRADVYALGVVLFEMLTGQLPGSEDPGAPPADEATLRDRLPRGAVADTVVFALAIEVAERLPDVPTFARSLYPDRPDLRAIALGQTAASAVPLSEVATPSPVPRANATLVASQTMDDGHRTFGEGAASASAGPPTASPTLPTAPSPPTVPIRESRPSRRASDSLLWIAAGSGILAVTLLAILLGYLIGRPGGSGTGPSIARDAVTPVAAAPEAGPPPATGTPGALPPAEPPALVVPPAPSPTPPPGGAPPPRVAIDAAPPSGGPATASPRGATPTSLPQASPPAATTPQPTSPAVADVAPPATTPVVLSPSAPVVAPTPDIQGTYAGTAGGRPAQVRLIRGEGSAVRAEVTLTLGVTDRTLKYMGTVDSKGAMNLMEDGGMGRLVVSVQNATIVGTVSLSGGKPLPLRGTLE